MRRRRFRRRLAWFPPIGSSLTIGEATFELAIDTFQVAVLGSGAENAIEIPLTFDFGTEEIQRFATPAVPAITLADLQGSGWQLRRCVGKLHATYSPIRNNDQVITGLDTGPPACYFGIGLMVRNVSGASSNTSGNVTVLGQDDATDPWIWRRTWVLGQGATLTQEGAFNQTSVAGNQVNRRIGAKGFSAQEAYAQFPQSNAHYGSAHEGTHIDSKTNRIIGTDERLFLHFSTKALPIQPQLNYTTDGDVWGVLDVRLLGNLRKMTNRRNASR